MRRRENGEGRERKARYKGEKRRTGKTENKIYVTTHLKN